MFGSFGLANQLGSIGYARPRKFREASINAHGPDSPSQQGQIKVYSPVRTAGHNSDPAHLQKEG
jgi:hypothetical protein